jgi:tetratricopeptide (TPR) repeat protein
MVFEKAREIEPINEWTWYNCAMIYYILGENEKAVEFMTKSHGINPNDNTIKFRLSDIKADFVSHIHKRMDDLLVKNVPDRCLYCRSAVAPGASQEEFIRFELRKIIWEVNQKLPIQAKSDLKATQHASVRETRFHTDLLGNVMRSTENVTRTYKERIKLGVPHLKLNEFVPLKGTICSKCAEDFINSVKKCVKKVDTGNLLSKIDKTQEEAEEEYNKLLESWWSKIN